MALTNEMIAYADKAWEDAAQIVRDLCKLPAPSHHEELRAEYCKKWFSDNGFENVTIDKALNVLAPVNMTDDNDITVLMAHTDTVFPDTEPMPFVEKDGFMYSPGVTDDTANLSVLMVCARYFRENYKFGNRGFLFVANSCEEGLGNLKGTRQIMADYGSRVKEFVSLDSTCMNRMVCEAVGSHRYKVIVRTEGGHSFGSFGNRNAIHVLSTMINALYSVKVPQEGSSRTTYNVGMISGGTSVNTIAQEAEMMYEYRSDNKSCLAKMQEIFEKTVAAFGAMGIEVEVEKLGDRPCSAEVDQEKFDILKNRARVALKETLDLEMTDRSGSTDCNIPLSMGIPAICFGVCRGGGVHTREEKLETASLHDGCKLFLDFLFRQ
ncbi:MAG: M20/M25/M40 family metallo-hydrolase [Lentisphaeria bacterium]|nr:M20/M25/M40 family metallo-hydrolase [Lentisphaeria bacterium]